LLFRITIGCCLLITAVATATADRSQLQHSTLAETVTAELKRSGAPGAVAGIFNGCGEPIEIAVTGWRDADRTTAIGRDDHFRLASLSKVFVGHLVLRLVDQQRLALTDPIGSYLPDYPRGETVTLRHCGNHTSGAFDPIYAQSFRRRIMEEPDKDWSAAELNAVSNRFTDDDAPVGQYRYGNINSTFLAAAAERATGRSYQELIEQLILQPAGATDTGFAPAALPDPAPRGYRHSPPGRWIGYGTEFTDVTFAGAGWTDAAGSMYSTLDDLAQLLPHVLTGRQLSEASRRELHRWIETGRAGEQYGFHIERRGDWMGHDGNVPGFSSAAWYHPELDRLIVVLVNLSNDSSGRPPATTIAQQLRKQLEQP